jgi:hypothetical protein
MPSKDIDRITREIIFVVDRIKQKASNGVCVNSNTAANVYANVTDDFVDIHKAATQDHVDPAWHFRDISSSPKKTSKSPDKRMNKMTKSVSPRKRNLMVQQRTVDFSGQNSRPDFYF